MHIKERKKTIAALAFVMPLIAACMVWHIEEGDILFATTFGIFLGVLTAYLFWNVLQLCKARKRKNKPTAAGEAVDRLAEETRMWKKEEFIVDMTLLFAACPSFAARHYRLWQEGRTLPWAALVWPSVLVAVVTSIVRYIKGQKKEDPLSDPSEEKP